MRPVKTLLQIATLLNLALSSAYACTFNKLDITPLNQEGDTVYIGKSDSIEIRFNNEKTDGSVEVFPEVPLTIINHKTNMQCEIKDGGIWVRDTVFLSDDKKMLLTREYSGSNSSLVFHNMNTCKKEAEISLPTLNWSLKKNAIQSENKTYKLASDCKPALLRK